MSFNQSLFLSTSYLIWWINSLAYEKDIPARTTIVIDRNPYDIGLFFEADNPIDITIRII